MVSGHLTLSVFPQVQAGEETVLSDEELIECAHAQR